MAAPKGNQYWRLAKGFAVGREKKFTPEELHTKAIEYFEWVEKHPIKENIVNGGKVVTVDRQRAMTQKGFCVFAGIDTSTLRNYEKDQVYLPIVTRVKDIIYCQKFEGAAAGIFNANIIAKELGLNESVNNEGVFDPTQPIKIEFGKGNLNAPKK